MSWALRGHVESGNFGETTLDGLSFSVLAAWPGAIHEGGGKAISFVDETADDEQLEALSRSFSVSDGIAYEYADRYGALGPFEYEG